MISGDYEIEYRFEDELDDKYEFNRNSDVIVYNGSKVGWGETFGYAMNKADKDGDYSGVDKLLDKMYGLDDEHVAFYYDTDLDNVEDLKNELEVVFNIKIFNITLIKGEPFGGFNIKHIEEQIKEYENER